MAAPHKMNILVTGASGFVGKNLLSQLRNIRDGKAKNYAVEGDLTLYEYDLGSTPEELDLYCRNVDFVFNLAGVNRPQDPAEFMKGNFGFASTLLDTLKKHGIRTKTLGKPSEGSTEILDAIRAGYVSYVINTRAILSGVHYEDGIAIRSAAAQNNITMFTSLDTVRVLLDVLELSLIHI